MGKYKRLGKNIILQTVGKFSSKLLVFLLVPLYTSVMTTEEYGIADYVNVTINLLYPIITLIIVEAEVRFALDPNEDKRQVFMFANIVGFAGIFIVFALTPLLTMNSILRDWYGLFILGLVSWVVYELFMHFAFGLDRVSTAASAGVINTFSTILVTIVALLFFKAGVTGYLIANALGNIVGAIYIFVKEHLFRYYLNPRKIERNLKKGMLKYSIPMIPNSISWWINNSADKYMIEFFHGASTMALLSVAYKIPSILVTVVGIFTSAWHISSVDQFGTEENKNFFRTVYKLFNMVLAFSTAICLIFTKEIASFLFKADFFEAWMIVPVLLIAYIFQGEATFLGSAFTASKKTNVLFVSTMLGSVVNVILNLILIPKYSNIGAAIATLCGYITICIIRYISAHKFMPLNVKLLDEGLSVMILCGLAVAAFQPMPIRLLVGIFGLLILLLIQQKSVKFFFENIDRVLRRIKTK